MWPQLTVQKDVKTVNLKTDVSVLGAAAIRARDLGFVSNTGLDNAIFDSVDDGSIVDAILSKPVFELKQTPFRGVLAIGILILLATFHVVVCFFVDRIVCQVNEAFFKHFGVVGVFLCGKTDQPLFQHENLQWVKTRDHYVYS